MKKEYINLVLRYLILIIVAIPNLYLFYLIFTPLTVYPVYFVFNLFYDVVLSNNTLLFNGYDLEIVNACVAGAAYYLLLMLNLATPKIKIKKRLKMILFSFSALLTLNVIRIIFLGFLHVAGSAFFDITHLVFWYFISIIFVVGLWFFQVKYFKIKEIPFYSDLKFLYKNSLFKK